jgi:hypothetical protein
LSNPSSDSYRNPLRHTGQDYSFAPRFLRPRDPFSPTNASRDIKPKENQGYYPFGSIWNNNVNGNVWILAGIVNNLANWVLIGNSSGNVITISDNSNTIVNPSPTGNIQFTGQLNENGTPNPFQTIISDPVNHSISINPMSTARWIVDPLGGNDPLRPNGTHTTIASAIASSVAGDTIIIMSSPNPYVENLNFKAGVNIVGHAGDQLNPNVVINGSHGYTETGSSSISNIRFTSSVSNLITVSGSNSSGLYLQNCYFSVGGAVNAISFTNTNASSFIFLNTCSGDILSAAGAIYNSSSVGTMRFNYCEFNNSGNSTTVNLCSAGIVSGSYTEFFNPLFYSGTGLCVWEHSIINTTALSVTSLTANGGAIQAFSSCILSSASASTISVSTGCQLGRCTLDTSNAASVIGSGIVAYTPIAFSLTASKITATHQPLNFGPIIQLVPISGGLSAQIMVGSGSPDTVVTAPIGSIFTRTDPAGATSRIYINTNGGTSWTNITCAA